MPQPSWPYFREPGCEGLLRHIAESPVVAAGAPTLLEAALVLSSRMRRNAGVLLNEFLREADVEIISFTRDRYEVAVDAFERYGKGGTLPLSLSGIA
jgi:ribonuclease VapC